MCRIAGRFTRVEPRRRAGRLVLGLLSDLPRKNCWTIAEWAGEATPDGMQRLLGRAKWAWSTQAGAGTPRRTGNCTFRARGPPTPTAPRRRARRGDRVRDQAGAGRSHGRPVPGRRAPGRLGRR
jgi:hypothetical protein